MLWWSTRGVSGRGMADGLSTAGNEDRHSLHCDGARFLTDHFGGPYSGKGRVIVKRTRQELPLQSFSTPYHRRFSAGYRTLGRCRANTAASRGPRSRRLSSDVSIPCHVLLPVLLVCPPPRRPKAWERWSWARQYRLHCFGSSLASPPVRLWLWGGCFFSRDWPAAFSWRKSVSIATTDRRSEVASTHS